MERGVQEGVTDTFFRVIRLPKCPSCHENISWLEYSAYERVACRFKRTEDGDDCEYVDWDMYTDIDVDTIEYRCPLCGEVVARREEDAERFLSEP